MRDLFLSILLSMGFLFTAQGSSGYTTTLQPQSTFCVSETYDGAYVQLANHVYPIAIQLANHVHPIAVQLANHIPIR